MVNACRPMNGTNAPACLTAPRTSKIPIDAIQISRISSARDGGGLFAVSSKHDRFHEGSDDIDRDHPGLSITALDHHTHQLAADGKDRATECSRNGDRSDED